MRDRWNPSVIIKGQIYHYIGHLMPDLNQKAKCIHYFMDSQGSTELSKGILHNDGEITTMKPGCCVSLTCKRTNLSNAKSLLFH